MIGFSDPCIFATFLQILSDFVHESDGVCVMVRIYGPDLVIDCVSSPCLWSLRIQHPFCLRSLLPSANPQQHVRFS